MVHIFYVSKRRQTRMLCGGVSLREKTFPTRRGGFEMALGGGRGGCEPKPYSCLSIRLEAVA